MNSNNVSPVIGKFRQTLLKIRDANATDVHLVAGTPWFVRIGGNLMPVGTDSRLSVTDIEKIVSHIILNSHKIEKHKIEDFLSFLTDFDCSYSLESVGRFRVNITSQRGTFALVIRPIPFENPTFQSLNLPEVLEKISLSQRGLILISGPGSSGKTSTIAAMINYINSVKGKKILTIENPIEYLHSNNKSIIIQREIGTDVYDYQNALKSSLRQNVDIISITDIKDSEIMNLVIRALSNGITVFAEVNAQNTLNAIQNLISLYPDKDQHYIRMILADNLTSVICQKLIPELEGEKRVLVYEILRNNENIRNMILKESQYDELRDEIEKEMTNYGMISFREHGKVLIKKGLIDKKWSSLLQGLDTDTI